MATREAVENTPMFPAPRRRHGGHGLRNTLLTTGASLVVLSAGYAISRGEQSSSPVIDNALVSDNSKPPEPPKPVEVPVVVPPPTEQTQSDKDKITPQKPEIQPFDNSIVSPEAYVVGEYIEWNVQGATVKGMGFVLKEEEQLKIPENLQVATDVYPKPHTYNGRRIVGVSNDGRRLTFIGALSVADGLTETGKDLPAGTVVGTVTSQSPVLEGTKYNLLILSPEPERNLRFPDQTKTPPLKINNTFTASALGGLAFYGPKTPQ